MDGSSITGYRSYVGFTTCVHSACVARRHLLNSFRLIARTCVLRRYDGRMLFHPGGNMSDGKPEVTAHTPGAPGEFSVLASQARDATGAACVAMVVIDATGNGGYSVAGSLEAQLLIPDLLEQVGST